MSDRIRSLRKARRLSQQALADACGVSPQAVQKWEYGKAEPSNSTRPRLCQALGITPAELLGGDEQSPHAAGSGGRAALDVARLEAVCVALQATLDQLSVELSPRQYARLIALLYESDEWVSRDQIPALIRLAS